MASFKDRAALVTNETVNNVVAVAAAQIALDVIKEQNTDADQRRVALAIGVINNPTVQAKRMTVFVVADNTIAKKAMADVGDPSLDGDITARLRDIWSNLAGIGTT